MNHHTVGGFAADFCVKGFVFFLSSITRLSCSIVPVPGQWVPGQRWGTFMDWLVSPAAQAELARSPKINFDVSSSKSALIKYLLAHLIWMWINGQSVSSCPLHLSNCRDLAERPPQHLPSLVCWISSFSVRLFTCVTSDFYPPVP